MFPSMRDHTNRFRLELLFGVEGVNSQASHVEMPEPSFAGGSVFFSGAFQGHNRGLGSLCQTSLHHPCTTGLFLSFVLLALPPSPAGPSVSSSVPLGRVLDKSKWIWLPCKACP